MTIVLRGLQSLLHRLYDVEHDHDVCDFLITDRGALSRFEPEIGRAHV